MRIDSFLTDDTVLDELGQRLARTRLARNMSQLQLAQEAGIAERTVARIERGESTTLVNFVRVLRALGLVEGLDQLVPEPAPNPLVELELRGRQRRRASTRRDSGGTRGGWLWGDERGDAA
jgi:transcriptional regulator with XRE-family HTH domain